MNKKLRKTITILGSLALIVLGSSLAFSEPGSGNDPLVTKGYVDKKISILKEDIDRKIGELSNNIDKDEEGNMENTASFQIVNVEKGQYLIGHMGTEIIMRYGKAKGYNLTEDAGLSDATEGSNIGNTEDLLPWDHLLIVPRDDGRGAYILEDAIFLVKGNYTIK